MPSTFRRRDILSIQKIDGFLLKEMIISAANLLELNKKVVDSLNVFPVPDGDTGTNMSLTMISAVKEVAAVDSDSISIIAEALARGSLKGARGNSGVILSQLFRGFFQNIKGQSSIDGFQFALALKSGVETAYKAVMKPTEGTILTVARISSEEAILQAHHDSDVILIMDSVLESSTNILARTPEMLPILKQAGVVDAGGQGLLFIYKGFKMAMNGREINTLPTEFNKNPLKNVLSRNQIHASKEEAQFVYCTEYFIENRLQAITDKEVSALKIMLQNIGDSLLVIADFGLVKVHVHTNSPNLVLQYGLQLGELSKIKIDNMREQHHDLQDDAGNKPHDTRDSKQYGMVAIAAGAGFSKIFTDLSVDMIIEGGQTMNPSIEDISNAIEKINADHIFIFPNNSNIILAADHAKTLTKKHIDIIPSQTIPQGIAAVIAFNPDDDFQENHKRMTEAIDNIKTGQVTFAVRTSVFDGNNILKGDIIGLANNKIKVVGQDIHQVSLSLLHYLVDKSDEIITIYYGMDISDSDARELFEDIKKQFPICEVELHSGEQPLYYYIFSIE